MSCPFMCLLSFLVSHTSVHAYVPLPGALQPRFQGPSALTKKAQPVKTAPFKLGGHRYNDRPPAIQQGAALEL